MRVILFGLLGACIGAGSSSGDDDDKNDIIYEDADDDSIIDLHEGYADPDGDEEATDTDDDDEPDYMDEDSDDDGIDDEDEAGDDDILTLPWDSDSDGIPDFRDEDSDENCLLDENERDQDLDSDDLLDAHDLDDDADGILDTIEMGADCAQRDLDGDGEPDYIDSDSDGDGIADFYEAGTSAWETEPRDTDGDGTPDYMDDDADGDGFPDRAEGGHPEGDDPPRDTDGDGIYDFADSDSDGDGIPDADEASYGTDPLVSDSDGDGFLDGAELSAGTNPADASSVIEGIYVIVEERTTVEENFSFNLSVQRGDIGFVLDTTCSMSSTLNGMSSEFSSIVSQLSAALPDAQYAVATFDDYNYNSYGGGSDKPFILVQQVTDSTSAVQSALSGLRLHSGGDTPESTIEALYQALTGTGYDQACNGRYDSTTDVKPFIASGGDPFNGGGGQTYTSGSSGGGTLGGMGFRDYALPVLIYATDAEMRDDDVASYGTPRGCPGDAGSSDVARAAGSLGASLVGSAVGNTGQVTEMNTLAQNTNSYADTDGDGRADDKLVFTWTGSSSTLRSTIVSAVTDLVSSLEFGSVTLEVEGDEHGFIVDVEPDSQVVSGGASGQELEFSLTFRGAIAASQEDQVYKVTLNVVGDGTILLDTLDVYVLVPGSSI